MEKKAEKKQITVCIGAYTELARCNAKVEMLKKNGFKGAKVAATDKYLYCVAGVYDDADAAAGAYKKLQELGLNPYNAEIKG